MIINKKISTMVLATMILSVAILGTIPIPQARASSNPNLFVSAENSQWNNYFAGPQVIQVVVLDPDINTLNTAYGEPTVTVNGKRLHMAQATDGNWYAYFADSRQAQIADSTQGNTGKGLDFGRFCSAASAVNATGVDFTDTKGIAIAQSAPGSANGVQSPSSHVSATCTGAADGAVTSIITNRSLLNHVVRENKTLNPGGAGTVTKAGQITSNNVALERAWPIIQLYDFGAIPLSVIVDYQKAGGDQIVNLTFDKIPTALINASLDASTYPIFSQVHVTVNDPQLNIDPTEQDSWTWGTSTTNNTVYYQAFDRSGKPDADGTSAMQNILGNLTSFNFNHNGRLTINPTSSGPWVVNFTSNKLQALDYSEGTQSIRGIDGPVTFLESSGVNTGIFKNSDSLNASDLVTSVDAPNGKSATLRYNDVYRGIIINGVPIPYKQLILGNLALAKLLIHQDRDMDAADKLLDTSRIIQANVPDPERTILFTMVSNAMYSNMLSATPGGVHDYPLQCQSHEIKAIVTPSPVGQLAFSYSSATGLYAPNITINQTENERCLPYLIRGADVTGAIFDENAHTLSLNITSSQSSSGAIRGTGQILLSIDRSLLDFKDSSGADLPFTSFVDGVQKNHQENNTATIRIVTVPFRVGISHITIAAASTHAPSSPVNLVQQTFLDNGTLRISWSAPINNGGAPIIQYNVERKLLDENSWKTIAQTSQISYAEEIPQDRIFLYRIFAVNNVGPGAPTIMGAEISKTSTIISGTSKDGSTLVLAKIEPRIPIVNVPLKITVSFYDTDGIIIKSKPYTISAFQGGTSVIKQISKSTGYNTGTDFTYTSNLPTSDPPSVTISFGSCPPNTPPNCNDSTVTKTVPEFGQVAMLILLISFASIALITSRFNSLK